MEPPDGNFGVQDKDGHWNGIVGMVINKVHCMLGMAMLLYGDVLVIQWVHHSTGMSLNGYVTQWICRSMPRTMSFNACVAQLMHHSI